MDLGGLVISTYFSGVGKIIDIKNKIYEISFFKSPEEPYANKIEIEGKHLKNYKLYTEQVVYFFDVEVSLWRRARYIGPYGATRHLIAIRQTGNENKIVELADIYILNANEDWVNPKNFLKVQANDAPYFYYFREKFIDAYIQQRAACCSIGAILSSSIELEPHQLAVVKCVLQDPIKKYLLADEVGLGKTIEAGLLIREHVLNLKDKAHILVIVPDHLVSQWKHELCFRFHLEDVMESDVNDQSNVEVISYYKYYTQLSKQPLQRTMVVVDEMHNVAAWAWSDELSKQLAYFRLVNICEHAQVVLLLSGTPLNGNEKNFLAMLHCLSPQHYQLDENGMRIFQSAIQQSEWLGGIRGALVADNENAIIEHILDELSQSFLDDATLHQMVDHLRPLVDFFDGREQDDVDRQQKIQQLNSYIGERYRLHERMLRNRRDSKGLNLLFPGLAGAKHYEWRIKQDSLSLEELILEYLIQYHPLDEIQYFAWFKAFMISPQIIARRCEYCSEVCENPDEKVLLDEIRHQAILEQKAKDQLLLELVKKAIDESEILKIIIFTEDTELSQMLYQLLLKEYPTSIEHHLTDQGISFNDPTSAIRILICDNSGEDGLNLQGAERLVIHYAMSSSMSRIEQRLGRVNRYCANLTGVKPVQNWIIVPEYDGIFKSWVDVLDNSVGIFNRTMASLQYVLETQFNQAWKESLREGVQAFKLLKQVLGDFRHPHSDSLIEREFKKVRAQEELMSLDENVQLAQNFAERISQSDEQSESDANGLLEWTVKVLNFDKKMEGPQQFRLGFKNGHGKDDARTLIDIANFIKNCILGIDSNNPPWTHIMSPSRRFLSADYTSVYPLRYGQPFVDAIFNLLKQDARGASCAIVRVFKQIKLPEPQIFFKSTWLITHQDSNAVVGDEIFAPRLEKIWLDLAGNIILHEHKFYQLLNAPYEDQRLKPILDETNIRADIWQPLKKQVNLDCWANWVDNTVECSKNILIKKFTDEIQCTLVGLQAQIYLSKS